MSQTTSPTARLMDGSALARRLGEETAERAAALTARTGQAPCLATVLVGEDPASVTYVRMKRNRCAKAGIRSRHVALPADTSTAQLVDTIGGLSADPGVHGILLQHPVARTSTSGPPSRRSRPRRTSTASPRTPSPR